MRKPFKRGSRAAAGAAKAGRASATTEGAAGTASDATKKGKYNAKGRHVGTQWCASEAEAVRYEQLLGMAERGLIEELRCQVKYPLVVNAVRIGGYVADFVYTYHDPDARDPRGEEIVEEVKGMETPEWKMKCKLAQALHGIRIRVIMRPKNKAEIAETAPELVELMHGKTGDFAHWIRLRYADRVPE